MDFDELESLAEAKRRRIEAAIAAACGQLRRASELEPRPESLSRGRPLEEVLPDARELERGSGRVRLRRVELSLDARPHPRGYLFPLAPRSQTWREELGSELLELLGCEDSPARPVTLERIAFFDTETTGLAGFSGTVAFLVGVGSFRCDAHGVVFVCEQYFIEDFPHEAALLELVAERFADSELLVSFNGRRYDLPLLAARSTLNRVRVRWGVPHLDLLEPSRRIWRRRLGSCRLAALEAHVLGVRRVCDIPGQLIPQVYFDHLRGIGRERLARVFDHNVQDIVSMAALLLVLTELAEDPTHSALVHAADAYGMGRLYLRCGQVAQACRYFERAWASAEDEALRRRLASELVRVYKRKGDVEGVTRLLRGECARCGGRDPQSWLALARWCEHGLRRPAEALRVVEEALRQAEFVSSLPGLEDRERARWEEARRELWRRRERLERRTSRG